MKYNRELMYQLKKLPVCDRIRCISYKAWKKISEPGLFWRFRLFIQLISSPKHLIDLNIKTVYKICKRFKKRFGVETTEYFNWISKVFCETSRKTLLLEKSVELTTMSHLFGVLEGTTIRKTEELEPLMEKVIRELNLTEVNRAFHQFEPQGTTGVIVLSESHFSAHTYPETEKVYLDLFCCSKDFKPDKAADVIRNIFGASDFKWSYVDRF